MIGNKPKIPYETSNFRQSLHKSGLFVQASLGKRNIVTLHANCTSAKARKSGSLMETVSLITTHNFDIITRTMFLVDEVPTSHQFVHEPLPCLHLLRQQSASLCSY